MHAMKFLAGLVALGSYDRSWLRDDLVAVGLHVSRRRTRAKLGGSRLYGGCSSGVERLTVAQEVAGSRPVTHPNSLNFIRYFACLSALAAASPKCLHETLHRCMYVAGNILPVSGRSRRRLRNSSSSKGAPRAPALVAPALADHQRILLRGWCLHRLWKNPSTVFVRYGFPRKVSRHPIYAPHSKGFASCTEQRSLSSRNMHRPSSFA
jgi:hypothetical protein